MIDQSKYLDILTEIAKQEGYEKSKLFVENETVFVREVGITTRSLCQIDTPYWKTIELMVKLRKSSALQ